MTREPRLQTWLPGPLDAAARAAIARLVATDEVQAVAIMPDAHLAEEVCVGTVAATDSTLLPAAIGGDIGCGVLALRFDGDGSVLRDERAAARVLAGLYRAVPAARHSRAQALPEPLTGARLREPRAAAVLDRDGRVQLGTLGRGNHFLELQQSDDDGRLWAAVHSGSRAFGQAVLDAHLPKTVATVTGLRCLDASSAEGEGYLADMALALAYADANRRAMMAAVTALVGVLVIPYRNPIFTARALATADYLSGGRVILGAGIGWWREEFAALGVPFEDRAARTVEALRLMREVWTRPRVEFEGRFWRVAEAGGTRPHPVQQPRIPIWIGGHSDAALRRVVEIADGWHPLGLRPPVRLEPDELAGRARRLAELAEKAGRDPADIVIAFKAPFGFRDGAGSDRTPLSGSPAQIVEDLQAYVAAGARHFVLDFSVPTPPEMLEAMARFAADVRPQVRDT